MTTLNQVLRTVARCVLPAVTAVALLGSTAHAAVPGITADPATHVFNLVASANRISQPDGQMIYTWGYGCAGGVPAGFAPWTPASTARRRGGKDWWDRAFGSRSRPPRTPARALRLSLSRTHQQHRSLPQRRGARHRGRLLVLARGAVGVVGGQGVQVHLTRVCVC